MLDGGDYRSGRSTRVQVELRDESERLLPDALSNYYSAGAMSGGLASTRSIEPGEALRIPFLLQLYALPRKPGEYRLKVSYNTWSKAVVAMPQAQVLRFRIEDRRWHRTDSDVERVFADSQLKADPCIARGFDPELSSVGPLLDQWFQEFPGSRNEEANRARNRAAHDAAKALSMFPVSYWVIPALDRLQVAMDEQERRAINAMLLNWGTPEEWGPPLLERLRNAYPGEWPLFDRIAVRNGLLDAGRLSEIARELKHHELPSNDHLEDMAAYLWRTRGRDDAFLRRMRDRYLQTIYRIAMRTHSASVRTSAASILFEEGALELGWWALNEVLRESSDWQHRSFGLSLAIEELLHPNPERASFLASPSSDSQRAEVTRGIRRLAIHESASPSEAILALALLQDRDGVSFLTATASRAPSARAPYAVAWAKALVGEYEDAAKMAATLEAGSRHYHLTTRLSTLLAKQVLASSAEVEALWRRDPVTSGDEEAILSRARCLVLEAILLRRSGDPDPDPDWPMEAGRRREADAR